MINIKDQQILIHILEYCDDINEIIKLCKESFNNFSTNRIYKNSAAMSLLQIGELTKKLSADFLSQYDKLPWKELARTRDFMAHHYGSFDEQIGWNTMKNDIPTVKEYCHRVLQTNHIIRKNNEFIR